MKFPTTCSSSQKNVVVSSSSLVSNNVELNKDDGDLLLMKACEDYEKSVSNIPLGGIFQGASLQNNKQIKNLCVNQLVL